MHPDALTASLKQELEQCTDEERRKEILSEIKNADGLERPTVTTETGHLEVMDRDRGYLDGLRQELEEVEVERRAEVKAEIRRIEDILSAKAEPTAPDGAEGDETVNESEPSVEEIEQRKQARSGRKGRVEQARSVPTPDQAPPAETAPDGAKE